MFWDLQPLKEIHIHQTSNIKQNGYLLTPKTQCPPNIVWNLTHFCHGVLSWPPWESDCRHPRLGRHHEYTDSTFVDTRLVRHFSGVLISFLKKSGSFRGFSWHFPAISVSFLRVSLPSRRGPGAVPVLGALRCVPRRCVETNFDGRGCRWEFCGILLGWTHGRLGLSSGKLT